MGEYRIAAEACKNQSTNCSCWNTLVKEVPAVKKCNIAGAKEKAIKKKLTLCKDISSACKKYEDKSIVYIATCKTSSNALKKILLALYQSLEKLSKVSSKTSSVTNATAKNARLGFAFDTSTDLLTAMTTFTTLASTLDADMIGSNDILKGLAKNISKTNTKSLSFTSTQITTAKTITVTLTVITVKVNARI